MYCCVTDFLSLTALLEYLVTYKVRAQSLSPDGKYQIVLNFVRTFHEPFDCAYCTFERCVVARSYQQTRFIVPVESAGADWVLIVPEDSGSHRHRGWYTQILTPKQSFEQSKLFCFIVVTFLFIETAMPVAAVNVDWRQRKDISRDLSILMPLLGK